METEARVGDVALQRATRQSAWKLLRIIDSVNCLTSKVIQYGILVIAAISLYEVVSRFAFNNPTKWAYEVVTALFGYYVALAGGYLVFRDGHIRVDLLYSRLSLRARAVLDTLTSFFSFVFIAMMLWLGPALALASFQVREHTTTTIAFPVYPSKIILVVGIVLLALQLIAKLARDLRTAVRGRGGEID